MLVMLPLNLNYLTTRMLGVQNRLLKRRSGLILTKIGIIILTAPSFTYASSVNSVVLNAVFAGKNSRCDSRLANTVGPKTSPSVTEYFGRTVPFPFTEAQVVGGSIEGQTFFVILAKTLSHSSKNLVFTVSIFDSRLDSHYLTAAEILSGSIMQATVDFVVDRGLETLSSHGLSVENDFGVLDLVGEDRRGRYKSLWINSAKVTLEQLENVVQEMLNSRFTAAEIIQTATEF